MVSGITHLTLKPLFNDKLKLKNNNNKNDNNNNKINNSELIYRG